MDKRFWGILIAVVIVLGGIYWLSGGKSNPGSTSSSNSTSPSQHIEGLGRDKVTLLEYGDYECPYCSEFYPIVNQVASKYNDQIYVQFRNLPLTEIHLNAFAAARAAEAASLQGKFWQMHDALYASQSQWVNASDPESYFVTYAQQIGLNIAKFKTDFSGSQVNNTINADLAAFAKTGAQQATPTFFLDGQQIQPTPTLSSFEQYINAAIAQKTGTKATS